MKIETKDNKGYISIDKNVVAEIAQQAVMENYGFVGLGYKNREILEILKGENISKGVRIEETEDGVLNIEIYVIVQYGVNIETVCNNAIEKIKYKVETMTSLKVNKIVVNVQGVKVV